VDYIPFINIIQQKHQALRALRYGDPEPWRVYLQETECLFWDNSDRPSTGSVVINSQIVKNKEGLRKHPQFNARRFALDRQQGIAARGEFPYWRLVIRDNLWNGDSLLIHEGKHLTDENCIEALDEFECIRAMGVADSGYDATHVYQFCLRYGIHAVKGEDERYFAHRVIESLADGSERTVLIKRIWEPERPLYLVAHAMRTRENSDEEPLFWRYSKGGIAERLNWLRAGNVVKWEVPGDVSDEYQKHLESHEIVEERDKRGQVSLVDKKLGPDDYLICERYIAMLMDMAGIIGAQAGRR
jgi:hypothetical protein